MSSEYDNCFMAIPANTIDMRRNDMSRVEEVQDETYEDSMAYDRKVTFDG